MSEDNENEPYVDIPAVPDGEDAAPAKIRDKTLYVKNLDLNATNIAEQLSIPQRALVGRLVVDETKDDIGSRSEYDERRAFWRKQFVGTPEPNRLRPFDSSCTAHVPIQTVGVMQFVARAEEYLLPSRGIARAKDTTKSRAGHARAERVGDFMQDQIESQIKGFRATHGLGYTQTAVDGSSAIKAFWDPTGGRHGAGTPKVLSVPAEDFIVSYTHSGDLSNAQRITQRIRLTRDEIRTRVNDGRFCEGGWDLDNVTSSELEDGGSIDYQRKQTDGVEPSSADSGLPRELYEQHRNLDLDGDGIGEPYICTVDKETSKLLRITSRRVTNKRGDLETLNHWVMLPFQWNISGFYPLGLGHLLEGLGVVSDSLIQQLVDAGTHQNNPGGFIGKQAGKKGTVRYVPGQFTEYDGYIEDLQKSIMIMPAVQPSSTLKEALGMVQGWSKEILSLSELMQGIQQPTNQTATTSLLLAKQGLTLFNAVFRRLRDALCELLELLYQLNRLHLEDSVYNETIGDTGQPEYQQWKDAHAQYGALVQKVMGVLADPNAPPMPPNVQQMLAERPPEFAFSVQDDFADTVDLYPTADPEVTSEAERLQIAQQVLQLVMSDQMSDPMSRWAAKRRYLEAMRVSDIEEVLPQPPQPGPPPDLGQYAQIAEILQGKPAITPPGKPPVYHIQHLQEIAEYKQRDGGWWVQQMTPDQAQMLDQHERDHMADLLRLQDPTSQQPGAQNGAAFSLPPDVLNSAPASGPPLAGLGQQGGGSPLQGAAREGDLRSSAPPSLLGSQPDLGPVLSGPNQGS